MTLHLRAARSPEDWALFKLLLEEYVVTDHADPKTSSIGADILDIPGRYAPPGGGALLAEVDGALAGCAAFTHTSHAGLAEMKRVFVRRAHRRLGLARALAAAVMAAARDAGYRRIAISTWDHNAGAIGLYAQLGFAPCAPFKAHPMQNLVFMDCDLASPPPPPKHV